MFQGRLYSGTAVTGALSHDAHHSARLLVVVHGVTGWVCVHRAPVVDVAWNPYLGQRGEWVLATLSDDTASNSDLGGGTLQVWRVLDLVQDSFTKAEAAKLQAALDADAEARAARKASAGQS